MYLQESGSLKVIADHCEVLRVGASKLVETAEAEEQILKAVTGVLLQRGVVACREDPPHCVRGEPCIACKEKLCHSPVILCGTGMVLVGAPL